MYFNTPNFVDSFKIRRTLRFCAGPLVLAIFCIRRGTWTINNWWWWLEMVVVVVGGNGGCWWLVVVVVVGVVNGGGGCW